MTETWANGYSSESSLRELSNEYQHDRVWMVFKKLWTKVASALEGLTSRGNVQDIYMVPITLNYLFITHVAKEL